MTTTNTVKSHAVDVTLAHFGLGKTAEEKKERPPLPLAQLAALSAISGANLGGMAARLTSKRPGDDAIFGARSGKGMLIGALAGMGLGYGVRRFSDAYRQKRDLKDNEKKAHYGMKMAAEKEDEEGQERKERLLGTVGAVSGAAFGASRTDRRPSLSDSWHRGTNTQLGHALLRTGGGALIGASAAVGYGRLHDHFARGYRKARDLKDNEKTSTEQLRHAYMSTGAINGALRGSVGGALVGGAVNVAAGDQDSNSLARFGAGALAGAGIGAGAGAGLGAWHGHHIHGSGTPFIRQAGVQTTPDGVSQQVSRTYHRTPGTFSNELMASTHPDTKSPDQATLSPLVRMAVTDQRARSLPPSKITTASYQHKIATISAEQLRHAYMSTGALNGALRGGGAGALVGGLANVAAGDQDSNSLARFGAGALAGAGIGAGAGAGLGAWHGHALAADPARFSSYTTGGHTGGPGATRHFDFRAPGTFTGERVSVTPPEGEKREFPQSGLLKKVWEHHSQPDVKLPLVRDYGGSTSTT